jgi:hypothetical protein
VHEVAALDDGSAVGGARHVVKVDAAVVGYEDVLQEGVFAEAGIVGFDLFARIQAVRLDEQAAALEAAESAVAANGAVVWQS